MNATMHRYSAYGVAIDSDCEMPLPRRDPRRDHLAAVTFTSATPDDFSDLDGVFDDAWFRTELLPDDSRYLRWSRFYECRVDADGGRIRCRPLHDTSPSVLMHFLFGQALSFALLQQGLEPLHAGVVRIDNQAVALVGDCTFGKSTLVASFASAGYRVVTDDLLIVTREDRRLTANPGTGRIKLNLDSARACLDGDRRGELLNPLGAKRSFPLSDREQQSTPLPITHVFALPAPDSRREATGVVVEPLAPASLFHELMKNAFNVDVFTRSRLERQFRQAAELATELHGFQLRYPPGFEHLAGVLEAIVDRVRRTRPISRSVQ